MQRLADERVTDMDEVTVQRVRNILKDLRERKFYEHSQLIVSKITGRPSPRLTPEAESKVRACFLAASSSFTRQQQQAGASASRKNFLSYSLVLSKIMELLDYQEFVPLLTTLKGSSKLRLADEMWRAICEDLNWTYIPILP